MKSLQNNNDHNATLSFADFNSNIQVDSSEEESSYEKNTTVNTFLDEHNHTLLPDTAIFSTEFRALPAKMKNNIEYFDMLNFIQKVKRQIVDTSNAQLTGIFWMSGEQQLLHAKYHDVLFHDKAAPI
ncbi:3123_t:CDS:2 [Rhizophagus irregularis]|nr:3123_t:CDS:2 [Rhizophagus irregularis]